MAWRDSYLDVLLIPIGLLFPAVYHLWLWHVVRLRPLRSAVGISAASRRLWVSGMMKDNDKKAVLVVQSLRNVIMGSTLVATTSILFCTGVAAVLSSTYAIKHTFNDAVFGAHGEFVAALKYGILLLFFLLAFLCHSLAICSLNQAGFLINALSPSSPAAALHIPVVTREYIADVLERGFLLSLAGNRLFFAGAPLLLWVFGPVLPCLCSMAVVPILYHIDMAVPAGDGSRSAGEAGGKVVMENGNTDQSSLPV